MAKLSPKAISLLKQLCGGAFRSTRIHPVFDSQTGRNVWVKREDELSAGVIGSKLRKYDSLIRHYQKAGVKIVAAIGGPHSNNLLGLAQVLPENGIKLHAFIREASDAKLFANALLMSMLLPEKQRTLISHQEWPSVERIARDKIRTSHPNATTHVLNEGAFCKEALPGALSLGFDLLKNEESLDTRFSHLSIDSGTGLTAIGLILALEAMGDSACEDRTIYVNHIAGSPEEFEAKRSDMRDSLQEIVGETLGARARIVHLTPPTAAKYGQVNTSVLRACWEVSRDTSLLMDPVYSIKHYMAFRDQIGSLPASATPLFIFNGSPLGLMGFQEQLAKLNR